MEGETVPCGQYHHTDRGRVCCIQNPFRTSVLIWCRFQTYFPHVDNVYSHRSTQRHKRKRFVSHYWDCRLKGRPPGTKKSTDPDKKKRKRVARERDLCDVKIKITEYFDAAELAEHTGLPPPGETTAFGALDNGNQPFAQGDGGMAASRGVNVRQASGKFYTMQRVNGNGGNGKGDGVAGPHKHTLEESDRVKKNSVQRWLLKNEREAKKTQVCILFLMLRGHSIFPLLDCGSYLLVRSQWCLVIPCPRTRFIAALRYCMAPASTRDQSTPSRHVNVGLLRTRCTRWVHDMM